MAKKDRQGIVAEQIEREWLNQLRTGRSLLYLASGSHVPEAYHQLPYDNIVLVDKIIVQPIQVLGKIFKLGLTALEATAVFRQLGIRFDAFVCINEGLSEGGGSYPIHSNWSMGTILPILKEEYLHIACPAYYGSGRWKKMFNLPQQAELISASDADYIDPRSFTRYGQWGTGSRVWRVKKVPGSSRSFKLGSRKITVQHQNIFDDYAVLDSLFVRCHTHEQPNLSRVAPKVQYFFKRGKAGSSWEEMLDFCNQNNIAKLGLTPWLKGQYNGFLRFLEARDQAQGYAYPREIHFYHLHQQDLQQLYERAENSSVQTPV